MDAQQRTCPEGVPSWIDLEQPDLGAAQAFYGGLFGWDFEVVGGGQYVVARLGGRDAAGLATPDPERPAGARFRLWEAGRRVGVQVANEPGAWSFSDLRGAEVSAVRSFYADVFGWELDDMGFSTLVRRPGYGDHLAATVDPGIHERQSGVDAPPGFADAVAWMSTTGPTGPAHWHTSFAVADRDASAADAERLGGTVVSSEDSVWTRTALVRDPQGAELTISQFTPGG